MLSRRRRHAHRHCAAGRQPGEIAATPSRSRDSKAARGAISRNLYNALLTALVASVNSEIGPGQNDLAP